MPMIEKAMVQKGALDQAHVNMFKSVLKPKMDMSRKVVVKTGKGVTPEKGNAWKAGMMGR
jgi:uncharacterized protein YnzC (UPF0291/DUF896 family)